MDLSQTNFVRRVCNCNWVEVCFFSFSSSPFAVKGVGVGVDLQVQSRGYVCSFMPGKS